jgi:hypothetical protein
MRWVAGLVILAAFASGRAAAEPNVWNIQEPGLLDDATVRKVFLPTNTLAGWAIEWARTGRCPEDLRARPRFNAGNVIGLQTPGVPTPDLDIPIRCTSFGPAIRVSPNR